AHHAEFSDELLEWVVTMKLSFGRDTEGAYARLSPMLEADLGDGRSLRQLGDADAEKLFELIDANRSHLANWSPFVSQTHTISDSLAFIRAARRQADENRGVQLAIVRDTKIIGVAGFHGIDWTRRSTSIGYWLAAAQQGAGTMTAA